MSVVQTELDGRGVFTITLNDPDNRNSLGLALTSELTDALDRADSDPAVRVVVLTNSGRVFCAGADLRERSGKDVPTKPDGSRYPRIDPVELFGRFRTSPKVFIGRLAGHCVAGGMGLAAAMDFAVADESAKFGFTEVRIGVAPAMISVLCLAKMRPADAANAFLRGNRFLAPEAARLGLIHAAVPADDLDAEVEAIVSDLLMAGPNALAATKRLLAEVPGMGIDDAFEWTKELSAELFRSEEAAEGMGAFLEKRPPSWVGDTTPS